MTMTTTDLESRLLALEEEIASIRRALESERIRQGIEKAREQADRGEVLPAREVLEAMRKKYNIQPL